MTTELGNSTWIIYSLLIYQIIGQPLNYSGGIICWKGHNKVGFVGIEKVIKGNHKRECISFG